MGLFGVGKIKQLKNYVSFENYSSFIKPHPLIPSP